MGSSLTLDTSGFPAVLDETEIELRGARQAFGWGPQCLWLICGLIWLFVYVVRDVREAATSVGLIGLGVTFFGVIAVFHDRRRRSRRIVLFPSGDLIGCYRGGRFQYGFPRQHFNPVRKDWFERAMLLIKVIIPLAAIVAALVFGIVYALTKEGQNIHAGDAILMLYALFFALFGLYAVIRSTFILQSYWIPDGNGKAESLYLEKNELKKLDAARPPGRLSH